MTSKHGPNTLATPAVLLLLLIGAVSLPSALPAQVVPEKQLWTCKETKVELDLSLLPRLDSTPEYDGWWYGDFEGHEWTVNFVTYPMKDYRLRSPSEVLAFLNEYQAKEESRAPEERVFVNKRLLAIKAGYAPFAIAAEADVKSGKGKLFVLTGVTRDHAYSIDITVTGADPGVARKQVEEFQTEGVSYDGDTWEPRWSDADLEAYWEENAPDSLLGKDSANRSKKKDAPKCIRTEHYVILTNSSSGKLFARKMEQCYDKIRAVFPFEEIPGNRLMPVLLFRTPDQYFEFYMKKAKVSRESAENSKGHAWQDYYATYYDSPNDPVHIHEATHQIFMNRLFLSGGGSWFQEGVAEYMCESTTDLRSTARRCFRKEDHVTLRAFIGIESLIDAGEDDRGQDLGETYYLLAGSLIAAIKDSEWGSANFMRFVTAVGSCPDNDVAAIEGALQRSLNLGIDELEEKWKEYYR